MMNTAEEETGIERLASTSIDPSKNMIETIPLTEVSVRRQSSSTPFLIIFGHRHPPTSAHT
jgi:hypothetical protein